MLEQVRKGVEILNAIRDKKAISEDDYFFLLSFIIDKPNDVTISPAYPHNIYPWTPITYQYTAKEKNE